MCQPENNLSKQRAMLDELLKKIPHPPQLMLEILDVLRSENSNYRQLLTVMNRDPGFIALVLQAASIRSLQAGKDPVETLERAVQVLGFEKLKRVAMSVCTFKLLDQRGREVALDMEYFWAHSFATAVAARALGQLNRFEKLDADECYSGGIISNIGTLYMGMIHGEKYARAYSQYTDDLQGPDVCRIERKETGTDHCALGEAIGKSFHFPGYMLRAIRSHHSYNSIDDLPVYEKVILLAGRVAALVLNVVNGVSVRALEQLQRDLYIHLNIEKSTVSGFLRSIIRQIPEQVQRFKMGDIGFQQELMAQVLEMKESLARKAAQSRSWQAYLEDPARYLPYGVAAAFKSIAATADESSRIEAINTTMENFIKIYGVLMLALLEQSGLQESDLYRKYLQKSGQPAMVGNWVGLIYRALALLGQTGQPLLPDGLHGLQDLRGPVRKFFECRNGYTHATDLKTKKKRREVYTRELQLVHEVVSAAGFCYNNFFFHVESVSITRRKDFLYMIKRWQGPLMEAQRPVESLRTGEQLVSGSEVYFYDGGAKKIFSCFPYLRRMDGDMPGMLLYRRRIDDTVFEYTGFQTGKEYRLSILEEEDDPENWLGTDLILAD